MSPAQFELLASIRQVIAQARGQVQRAAKSAMLQAYWQIGRFFA